jgi:hypothetical protein
VPIELGELSLAELAAAARVNLEAKREERRAQQAQLEEDVLALEDDMARRCRAREVQRGSARK